MDTGSFLFVNGRCDAFEGKNYFCNRPGEKRWPMVVGRWPKKATGEGAMAVGRWPKEMKAVGLKKGPWCLAASAA
jgi:hypothetical protein